MMILDLLLNAIKMDWRMLDYKSNKTPPNYICDNCKVENVKLWRQSYAFLNDIKLLCFECSKKDQSKLDWNWQYSYSGETVFNNTDQIGSLIPAVPTEDCSTYWGYTSTPLEGCRWWHKLNPICKTGFADKYLVSDKEWENYLRKIQKEENIRKLTKREPFNVEDCRCLIEASHDEQLFLWQEWSNESDWDNEQKTRSKFKVNWKHISQGYSETIGHIDNRPICVCIFFALIEDEIVGFYKGISQLVDHKMIEEWIIKKNPKAYKTNSINFGNAIHYIKGDKK